MLKKSVRLSRDFRPLRYELTVTPHLTDFTFSGSETLHFNLSKPTNRITLHCLEIDIQSVAVRIQKLHVRPSKISFDLKTETVTFVFKDTLTKATGTLHIEYTGILNDKMRGFYRSAYEVGGTPHTMATTQFESTYARYAFPCVDEPGSKAVFDVTLVVPHDHVAISNTLPIKTERHSETRTAHTFSPTPLMSTYLLAFVVGKFEWLEKLSKNGTLVRVFVTPGYKHQATFALEVAVKSLDFFEQYFKIKYPLPVLDNIAIPDFSAGAMENWGAITYRESAILYDPQKSSANHKQRTALIIAHEIAHQWFGNLVTMDWWTDLWLNEGFATYIEYLAVDHIFPEWDIWTQFAFTEQSEAFHLDALASTHAIEIPVHHPSEIKEIFDTVSYAKGASIILMLATYLGEKDFREGLHQYLKRHAYSNTVTTDLWKAFERVSKKPVSKLMRTWTGHPGYPLVKAEQSNTGLSVSQQRFFSNARAAKMSQDTTRWSIPLQIRAPHTTKTTPLLMGTARASVPGTTPRILNAGAAGFFRTEYDTTTLHSLRAAVQNKTLTARERLQLQNDAFALAESGNAPLTSALDLARAYVHETDYSVWASLVANLNRVGALLAGTAAEQSFNAYVIALTLPTASKLGWSPKKQEPHTTRLLRTLLYVALGNAGHTDTVQKALATFKTIASGKEVDADLRWISFLLAAKHGTVGTLRTLIRLYEEESLHAAKNRILQALTCLPTPDLITQALDYTLSSHVRYQDTRWGFIGAWSTEVGSKVAWRFTKKYWATLVERYSTAGHDLPRFVAWTGGFKTEKDLSDVKKFFKTHKAPGAERAVQQAVESIESNILRLKRDLAPTVRWLSTSVESGVRRTRSRASR